jgi:hypothetical protein
MLWWSQQRCERTAERMRGSAWRPVAFHLALLAGLWIFAATAGAAQIPAADPGAACSHKFQKSASNVEAYTFKTYENAQTGDACLQVLRDRREVFRRAYGNHGRFTLGQPGDSELKTPPIQNGTDITGRGRPDMIVSFFTGGSHCCLLHYVFELEPQLQLLATLDAGDGDGAHFSALDRGYYYLANDWNFAYWNTSFANSPAPPVILRFVDDPKARGYHLALDKMTRPAPARQDWAKASMEATQAFADDSPFSGGTGSKLWGDMLDLIYTGHSNLAWKLFNEAWPPRRPGKDKFLADFCSELTTSPYWPDLQTALVDRPPACANARLEQAR